MLKHSVKDVLHIVVLRKITGESIVRVADCLFAFIGVQVNVASVA